MSEGLLGHFFFVLVLISPLQGLVKPIDLSLFLFLLQLPGLQLAAGE